MPVQFRRMLKLGFMAVFRSKGTDARLTPGRIKMLLFLTPAFSFFFILNWICMLLDEIIFRGFRKIEPEKPLFIVGPPRSGTTFLHRVLARDEQFSAMRLWEILFAPSIIQKKILRALGRIDDRLGNPLTNFVLKREEKIFHNFNKMHPVSLFAAEEDDGILFNIFASYFLVMPLPFYDKIRPFVHFDEELPEKERMRIMNFYKSCVKRHIYVFGKEKHFLSKNPAFSSKIETLNKIFPDARFIYTIRTPLEGVPSALSLITHFIEVFCDFGEDTEKNEFILDLLSHWYRYPMEKIALLPNERHAVIEYSELISDPMAVIVRAYGRMDYELSSKTLLVLAEENHNVRSYRSRHVYDFGSYGLTPEQVETDYTDVMDQFGYSVFRLPEMAEERV